MLHYLPKAAQCAPLRGSFSGLVQLTNSRDGSFEDTAWMNMLLLHVKHPYNFHKYLQKCRKNYKQDRRMPLHTKCGV